MKTLNRFIMTLALVLAVMSPAFAQSAYTRTTLSAAVTNTQTTFTVGSSTGLGPVTNPITGQGTVNQIAVIDKEMVEITAAPTATTISVRRGAGRVAISGHSSGAVVFVGTPNQFANARKYGKCTASEEAVLPVFANNNGTVELYGCPNSQWVQHLMPNEADSVSGAVQKFCTVPVGSVAYGSFGTDTAAVADDLFIISLELPVSGVFTGLEVLLGSATDGTNKDIVWLARQDGDKILANSAVAGVAPTADDALTAFAFTATVFLPNGTYWVALHTDAADAGAFRTVAASTFPGKFAVKRDVTFGAITTITEPTSFTADTGPIMCLYR